MKNGPEINEFPEQVDMDPKNIDSMLKQLEAEAAKHVKDLGIEKQEI